MFQKYKCTMQHDASDCGAAAVSTVLLTYNQEIPILKIREIIGTDSYGTTVKGIVEGLKKLSFKVKPVRIDVANITEEITMPAIAQIHTKEGLFHFVVVHKVKKNLITIADPAKGIRKLSLGEFGEEFTGVLILMVSESGFEKIKHGNKSMLELFNMLILPQKSLLITIILASLLLNIVGILSSTFSKVLMDEIIPYQLKKSLYIFLITFGIVALIQNLLSSFRTQIILFLSRKVDIPLLMGYYNHIIHLPYEFFASRRVGDIITRFQDAMTIKEIFTSVSISLAIDVPLAIITGIILLNLNATLFFILIIIVMVNIILIYIFKKPYKKLNYEQMESSALMNSHLIESMQNIETVKSQNDEHAQIDKLESRYISLLKLGYKEETLKNIQGFISNFVGTFGNLIFMGIGSLFIIDGKMSIGDLLVFQTLSHYFVEPVQSLVSLQLTFQEANIAMKRLSELMTLDREDKQQVKKVKDISLKGDIQFKDVSFAYGPRPPIMDNFNLTVKQGQKIALVGESGAGKSTLAKLLMKFMEVNTGKIQIAGYDIKDIDINYLRQHVSYLSQNIEMFTGTIIDNLKVGNPHAKYEEILNACKISGANAFIDRLPGRFSAFIEEGGNNLSGGEKQRLAIARALIANPDIYIYLMKQQVT